MSWRGNRCKGRLHDGGGPLPLVCPVRRKKKGVVDALRDRKKPIKGGELSVDSSLRRCRFAPFFVGTMLARTESTPVIRGHAGSPATLFSTVRNNLGNTDLLRGGEDLHKTA